ncbi:MAG: hypothetical protein RL219_1782 [Actinomycetota bacterium]|jgi:hypothetical protein
MNAQRVPWEMIAVAIAGSVGLVDAAVGHAADLVVVFAVVVLLALVAMARSLVSRRRIPVRADVLAWLEETSLAEGEPVNDVADRALAAARAGIANTSADTSPGRAR